MASGPRESLSDSTTSRSAADLPRLHYTTAASSIELHPAIPASSNLKSAWRFPTRAMGKPTGLAWPATCRMADANNI